MQENLNIELLNKIMLDLYKATNTKDLSIDAGIEIFYNHIKLNSRDATIKYYKSQLNIILDFLKRNNINYFSLINQELIEKYINECKNVKNITINKRITALLYVIKVLKEKDLISNINIKFHKLKETKPEIKTIDINTLNKILEYIKTKSYIDQAAILLLIQTGIRRTELVNIKTKNIDLINNSIFLEYTKTNQNRYIFFDNDTKEILTKVINNNNEYLFTFNNKKMSPNSVSNLCTRIKNEIKLDKLSPHKFRHTYATILLENGADIETVRLLLGHSTYEMTKRYLHIKNKKLKDSSLKLNPLTLLKQE
ncbi:MAG: tyrosine-type recombinase/integrase [Anaeroplasmataceae bacterium]